MNKWTPVTEALPPHDQYIVTFIGSNHAGHPEHEPLVRSAYFDGRFWWDDETYESFKVIAWMPLPEPYKP